MWHVTRVAETASTNADVAELARNAAPEGTVLVADHQTAGRGRLDRTWDTPAGTSLTVSFLLRPADVPPARWPWLPLVVGVAVADAVHHVTGISAALKWPNDVLVGDRKLAGILVETVDSADGPAVVAGVGLNVTQGMDQLPAGGISLASAGADVGRDDVLEALGMCLEERYTSWRLAGGDPAAELADAYRHRCATLRRRVRAELPGGAVVEGRAADVDPAGRLVIDTADGPVVVGAGDVVHLRAVTEPDRPSR
ncbi:biotin--[acetyl-CoA-carboxylase] ligase [Phytoactinopolyspora alkaliphila]|uniref:biotin--[biotin carboxyl-carrier protein] ligase n=1 Tax=Phytoactinopolyspora alkaliphila TaxID=1783498 RepID=A0A6N9YJR2_9ACTN|nr:biotin--[acetyl-CoA-carboxylase] ligase [Phytoactinopolyspora alkaliphila]NED95187.1 biotin--[acetyl-CoA-carboxylase] ligase [Phytoactinopolyspora alkaliphila]